MYNEDGKTIHGAIPSKSLLYSINSGNIRGHKIKRMYGINPDVQSTIPAYVWDGQGEYVYDSSNVNINLFSDNVLDTNVSVEVSGLVEVNGQWVEKTASVQLNGQTPVSAGLFIRVFYLKVVSGVSPVGSVFASTGGYNATPPLSELRAKISINTKTNKSRNESKMSMFTVPSNHTVFLYKLFASVRKNGDGEFDFEYRTPGGVFLSSGVITVFEDSKQFELGFEALPEKTDIRVAVSTESNNTQCRSSFHFILAHNDRLKI